MPAYRYENEKIENKYAIAFDEHYSKYVANWDSFSENEKLKIQRKANTLSKAREDELARNRMIEDLNKYREADFLGLTQYRLMRNSNLKQASARYFIEIDNYCPEIPSSIYHGYKDLAQYKSHLEELLVLCKKFQVDQVNKQWLENAISKIDSYLLHQKFSKDLEDKPATKKMKI